MCVNIHKIIKIIIIIIIYIYFYKYIYNQLVEIPQANCFATFGFSARQGSLPDICSFSIFSRKCPRTSLNLINTSINAKGSEKVNNYCKYRLTTYVISDSVSSIMLKSLQNLLWYRWSNIHIKKGFRTSAALYIQYGPTTTNNAWYGNINVLKLYVNVNVNWAAAYST